MVIATFGPTTGWVGKTITYDAGRFFLEGHGEIRADHVVEYDRQGHLVWPYDGMRAWVYSMSGTSPVASESVRSVQTSSAGHASPATAASGSTLDGVAEVLIFDTETSGFPKNWHASPTDVGAWPRVVQISWVMCDTELRELRGYRTLIRPDGWSIDPEAQRVHGISAEQAARDGMAIADMLRAFAADLEACSLVVAHNLEFDEAVMTAEFIRAGIPHHFGDRRGFCTMKGTVDLCRIEPMMRGHYKYPKLAELHEVVTGTKLVGAHDSMADVQAIVRCLRVLKDRGMLQFEVVPRGVDPDARATPAREKGRGPILATEIPAASRERFAKLTASSRSYWHIIEEGHTAHIYNGLDYAGEFPVTYCEQYVEREWTIMQGIPGAVPVCKRCARKFL